MSTSSSLAACVIGAVLLGGLTADSSWAAEPPNPKDLTQGTWELDSSKTKYCEGQSQGQRAPQSSRRNIIDAGWGLISVHWNRGRCGRQADGYPLRLSLRRAEVPSRHWRPGE